MTQSDFLFKGIALVATLLFGGILLLSSVQIVQPGQVKTVTYFGDLQNQTLDEGLHIINPLKSTRAYDVKSQTFTMSAGEGDRTIQALTSSRIRLESRSALSAS